MVKVEGLLLSADVLVVCIWFCFVLPSAAFGVCSVDLGSLFKKVPDSFVWARYVELIVPRTDTCVYYSV